MAKRGGPSFYGDYENSPAKENIEIIMLQISPKNITTPTPKVNSFDKYLWVTAVFVTLLTFVVFIPALQNEFVNWDDDRYVSKNPNLRSINLVWILTATVESNWHPVTMLSHAIDMALWGQNAWGHHLTSNIFHSLNTFLVFILVMHLMKQTNANHNVNTILVPCLVTSTLFGIHPLHVESVAWISERKDVLCAFFFLLSLLGYINYIVSKKTNAYIISIIFYILSLMSKPMAITLPVVLLILDYYPFKRISFTNGSKIVVLEKIPFFSLSLLFSIIAIWTQSSAGSLSSMDSLPSSTRIIAAVYAYSFYLLKILLPLNLAPFNPYPEKIIIFSLEYVASFISLAIIILVALFKIKKNNLFSAITFYYIITLLPVIGLVHVGGQITADRYTYLPSIGIFLLFGLSIGSLTKKSLTITYKIILIIALLFITGTLISKTVTQIAVWHDSITLWNHQIKLFPNKVAKAYFNRGFAYSKLGNDVQTIKDFSIGITINPNDQRAYYYRGLAYRNLGFDEKANEDFKRARGLKHELPGSVQAK